MKVNNKIRTAVFITFKSSSNNGINIKNNIININPPFTLINILKNN